MFILFGTKGITLTQQSGTFHCPQCGPQAPFSQKGVRRFFTLFFVPLIPLNQVAAYVECHRCRGQFDLNVLQWNPNPGAPPPVGLMPGMPGRIPSLPNANITQRSNGMATASMVLGIIGLVTSFLLCPSFLLIPLSLLFGIIGLTQAGKTGTGKGKAFAGIACSLAALVVVAILFNIGKKAAENAPPLTVLEVAKKNVASARSLTSHGNTEEAKAMAESVAKQLQLMHDTMIVASKGNKTTDQYAVHCELHEKTCVFLIFVPDYRKFEDELKNDMDEMAWSVAADAAQKSGKLDAADAELCVGLKGLVMFGSIMTGGVNDESPKKTSSNENELKRFFPEQKTAVDAVTPEP